MPTTTSATPARSPFSLVSRIIFISPSASADTVGAAGEPASPVASRIVVPTNAGGTRAAAGAWERSAAIPPAPSATPRRVSRRASILRADASRFDSVPSGMPSRSAASFRVRPSRSHRRMTAR